MACLPVPEQSFIILDEVGSTNNYAMARISERPVAEGTVYFARKQVAGKGRRGKQWISAPGENILLSLILRPVHLPLSARFMLSAAVALGSYDFVKKYAGEGACIKWSNDIYWYDRKAGGILIENSIRGQSWNYAVAGIGINVNQQVFPGLFPNPVSLRQITGKDYPVEALARGLAQAVLSRYARLTPANFDSFLQEYNSVLYRRGEPGKYRMGDEYFTATLLHADHAGKLVLEKGDGRIEAGFGEIEFIR